MVNFVITTWPATTDTQRYASMALALAALETQLETVDNAKTVFAARVIWDGKYFVPYLIYTT